MLRRLRRLARRSLDGLNQAVAWLRWYVKRPPYPKTDALRLHLGCGHVDHPGFVNVDGRPAPHVHHVQGLDRLGGFNDGVAALVYASHCLEHMPRNDLKRVLAEWHRVLQPGGVVRISVPDFDLMVDTYLDTARDVQSVQMPLMGEQNYPLNFHYVAFTERFLSELLVQAGFHSPRRWQHGEDEWASVPDWSGRSMVFNGKTYPVSLNLQATK